MVSLIYWDIMVTWRFIGIYGDLWIEDDFKISQWEIHQNGGIHEWNVRVYFLG